LDSSCEGADETVYLLKSRTGTLLAV